MKTKVDSEKDEYYSRQIILPEIGLEGQKKLEQKKILIVGAGGLGHPVATYLAVSGVGEIGIVDFDKVEVSNLNRQVCFNLKDLNKKKSKILAKKIQQQNPYIQVKGIQKKINPTNVKKIVKDFDLVVDCSDNFPTKFLLHDCAWFLSKDLVQASVYQYEGQLQSFCYSKSKSNGCLRCLWSATPKQNCVKDCQQSGIIGAVAGSLGVLQAMEVIKMIVNLGVSNPNLTIILNLISMEMKKIKWRKSDTCPLCSSKPSIRGIDTDNYFVLEEFELKRLEHKDFLLIDIREKNELTNDNLLTRYEFHHFPLSMLSFWKNKISHRKKYLFVCQKGIRSGQLVRAFREENMENCFSLCGGIEGIEKR